MKQGLILALVVMFSSLSGQNNQQVLYGERSNHFIPVEGVIRIFFDQDGNLYPDDYIADSSLVASNASLRDYYADNVDAFIEVSRKYELIVSDYSPQHFDLLQQELQRQLIGSINDLGEQHSLFVLIHGFRKPMTPRSWSTTSQRDYELMRNSIADTYAKQEEPRFVEIYWDGTYDCCIGRKTRVNKRIFQLYEEVAQVNAATTGYALRKLLTPLQRDEFTVVTHSLGAQVGLSLLTNVFDDRVTPEQQSLPTPQQAKVNLCLVAPAISKEPFEEYYQRTTALEFAQTDNYHLSILYNEKDFVLKKRWKIFGPGPRKYGNTSLGCNCKDEVFKLQEYFSEEFPNSPLDLYDARIGGTHSARRYAVSKAFASYLETLLVDK